MKKWSSENRTNQTGDYGLALNHSVPVSQFAAKSMPNVTGVVIIAIVYIIQKLQPKTCTHAMPAQPANTSGRQENTGLVSFGLHNDVHVN